MVGTLILKWSQRMASAQRETGVWSLKKVDLDQLYPVIAFVPAAIPLTLSWATFSLNDKILREKFKQP